MTEVRLNRVAGPLGVTILGIKYSSDVLLALGSPISGSRLEILFDDQDVSKISFKHPGIGQWLDARSLRGDLDGVSAKEWQLKVEREGLNTLSWWPRRDAPSRLH